MKNLILMLLIAFACPLIHAEKPVQSNQGASLDRPGGQAHEANKAQKDQGKANEKKEPPLTVTCQDSSQRREAKEKEDAIQRDKDDLIAQQEMAKASKESVVYTYRGLVISALAFLISAALGMFSIWSGIITLRETQRSNRLDLRAYIKLTALVVDREILNRIIDGSSNHMNGVAYTVKIENVGRSPARQLRIRSSARFDRWQNPNEDEFTLGTDGLSSRIDLSPGGTSENTISFTQQPVDPTFRSGLQSGEMVMFIYGRITYQDVFGNECWTTFRFFHKVGRTGSFDDKLVMHSNGNETT